MKQVYGIVFLVMAGIQLFSQQPVSLNGIWKFTLQPRGEFWKNEVNPASWNDIKVPGECQMQGYKIEQDKEYPYKKEVHIPADYKNRKILIRFDGVYSYARVWVNGIFVRDHYCGFTTWYCDITNLVQAGEKVWITVGMTDKKDDISRESEYAHHPVGGILRNVTLMSLPKDNMKTFHIETDFNNEQTTGILKVKMAMEFAKLSKVKVLVSLYDKAGKPVKMDKGSVDISKKNPVSDQTFFIDKPILWNAEQPYLYTLEADVWNGDELVQVMKKKIGFRKVEVFGNQLLVNGTAVKLHGACRHDVHPLLGRSTTDALDLKDVMLFKEANINFVRTSHYPPTEHFLDLCDEYGIYVEEENAICFNHNHPDQKPLNTNDEPYVTRAVEQMAEIIEKDRDHACVIIWSIGNESMYGKMFQKEYEFVKAADKTRPAIFSYPETAIRNNAKCYDILSLHYPGYKGYMKGDSWQPESKTFKNDTMPELNDEFAHVSCYNKTTLVSDPGIRDFWGESIDRFWASMYDSTGCLGGAIWAWADEIFMLPDTCVGYGPWGVVDGWRRRKPEFWHVKKAYSPVKITGYNLSKDRKLALTIANRFDHTSLNKVTIYWSEKGANQHWKLPDAMPHKKLLFVLPRPVEDDIVNIYFYLDSLLIDGYSVILKMPDHSVSGMQASVLKLAKTRESTVISNEFINASFSNATGKINHIVFQNDTLLTGGPIPDLGLMNHQKSWESQKTSGIRDIISEGQWKLKTFNVKQEKENVIVSAEGTYDTLRMSYSITFTPDGKMNVKYSLGSITGIAPQAGLRFAVSQKADKVTWRKRGYWSIYPDDHIGRLNGIASIRNPMTEQYRVEPTWGWNYDTKDYFLGGPQVSDSIYKFVNRDYSSRKMNFFLYGVGFTGTTSMFTVRSDGSMSAKMDVMKNSTQYLSVDRFWSYPDLSWGNYEGDKTPSEANGEFSIILNKARR